MSKIHYFQRYDSKENWITNSTLLLLSRFYQHNRSKFEIVLNSILNESNVAINTGVLFTQQEWGKSSVVDGIIAQDSFKILIETKIADNFTIDQLKRHLDAFGNNHSKKVLLALSKNKIHPQYKEQIIEILKTEPYKDIKFATTSYEDIFQKISDNLSDFDFEMREILNDYIALCDEHGLTNIQNRTLLAFTAGDSFDDNLKYNIYYDTATRNHNTPFKYIGLYRNKKIQAVGKVEKIVYCDLENGELVPTFNDDLSQLSLDEYSRIKNTIINTNYYDLEEGIKFFLVDKFYETNFVKTSYSSLRGKRYFWLDEIEGFKEAMNTEQLASILRDKTWE